MPEHVTFATGNIHLLYDEVEWRPDYYTQNHVHKSDAANVHRNIAEGVTCIINEELLDLDPTLGGYPEDVVYAYTELKRELPRVELVERLQAGETPEEGWSTDPSAGIFSMGSGIYHPFQLAHIMGMDRMYVLGADLFDIPQQHMLFPDGDDPSYAWLSHPIKHLPDAVSFVRQAQSPLKTLGNLLAFVALAYVNRYHQFVPDQHFSSTYEQRYNPGWRNVKLERLHEIVRLFGERYGFEVYNATVGGYLEVYERVDVSTLTVDADECDAQPEA